ncbi:MAG TPA: cupin domain-containing protein [Burkholderiales bacterium]|nr:cupin domain-containing protein [Burkholderiales bacterium]
MKLTVGIAAIALAAPGGAALAQQQSEKRTALLNTELAGAPGFEVHMWRTDIGPGVTGSRHWHPGTECIYVLEGNMELEEQGAGIVRLKAGDAHCVKPHTVLVPRNASGTEPYKSLVVMIAPKGQPIAVPVK